MKKQELIEAFNAIEKIVQSTKLTKPQHDVLAEALSEMSKMIIELKETKEGEEDGKRTSSQL